MHLDDEKLVARLEALAAERGVSVDDVVADALAKFVEDNE